MAEAETFVRAYRPDDRDAVIIVTVRAIRESAIRDYSPSQIEAWAGVDRIDALRLEKSLGSGYRKGRLQEDADADVIVFNPQTVSDRANYQAPRRAERWDAIRDRRRNDVDRTGEMGLKHLSRQTTLRSAQRLREILMWEHVGSEALRSS